MIGDFFKNNNIIKAIKSVNLILNDPFQYEMSDINISDSYDFVRPAGSKKLFLGRFSDKHMYSMMERVGLVKYLKSIGFKNLIIDVDMDVNQLSYFNLFFDDKIPEKHLIDLRMSESSFLPEKQYFDDDIDIIPYKLILVEWLSLKNPAKKFDKENPQLPGQSCPGLGALKYCFEMFYIMAKLSIKDGFMNVPDHMSGAIMYSKKNKFFNPVMEGEIRAFERDLRDYSLADISWGVITETIIDQTTWNPAVYHPSETIYYVSGRMKQYFKSKKYRKVFLENYRKKKYFFNYDEMVKRREVILQSKRLEDL